MPNWTSNIINADGDEADIRELIAALSGPDSPLDFNRIIPMPPLLRHTASGGRTFDGVKHNNWYVIDPDLEYPDRLADKNQRPFTPEEIAALDDIGHESWYDWSIHNWGTKWNACRAELETLTGPPAGAVFRFETAWSAPLSVFRKLAELFPRITLEFTWTDEDEPELSHSLTSMANTDEGRAA